MSTKELQESIIQKIRRTNDDELLNYLNQILSSYYTSAEQKVKIMEGQDQIVKGNYFTNEQVEKELDQWLNKE